MKRLMIGAREDYKRNSLRQSEEVTTRSANKGREVFRESAILLTNVLTATKPRYGYVNWFGQMQGSLVLIRIYCNIVVGALVDAPCLLTLVRVCSLVAIYLVINRDCLKSLPPPS